MSPPINQPVVLSNFGRMTKEHHLRHLPKLARLYQEEGRLDSEMQKLATQARVNMADLMESGLSWDQAWELQRDLLFPPSSQDL